MIEPNTPRFTGSHTPRPRNNGRSVDIYRYAAPIKTGPGGDFDRNYTPSINEGRSVGWLVAWIVGLILLGASATVYMNYQPDAATADTQATQREARP